MHKTWDKISAEIHQYFILSQMARDTHYNKQLQLTIRFAIYVDIVSATHCTDNRDRKY